MPLAICPNCNISMQTVNRTGVQIDVCPTCRGIWLDRGELEQLLSHVCQGESLWQQVNHDYFSKSGRDMPVNPFAHVLRVFD